MSQQRLKAQLDSWRNRNNPLVGMDAARVLRYKTDAKAGNFSDLQWALRSVIASWPILRTLRERRATALERLEWSVKTVAKLPPGATEEQAQAQADALSQFYGRIDNVTAAIRFLSLAEFTGYSHLQKHRGGNGDIVHLEPLDQWNWVRDGYRGDWYWNPTGEPIMAQTLKGRPNAIIDPTEFVIREVENPLYELAFALYLADNLALWKWVEYTEIFGIPRPDVVKPQGPLTTAQEDEFEDAILARATGAGGAWPFGSVISYPSENRAEPPFPKLLTEIEARIVLACTGSKLTVLTGSTGIGSSTGDAHADSFAEIVAGEAKQISECFQRQIDKPFLAAAFPGQPELAFWSLAAADEKDITEVCTQIATLKQAGYRTDAGQVQEITGYQVEVVEVPAALSAAAAGDGGQHQDPEPDPEPDTNGDAKTEEEGVTA